MILEKTLRYFILATIFSLTLVPFIVADTLFFPYITGKNFAYRIIVEMMGGVWIVLALLNANYRPRRSWVLTAFTVFVLIIGLADATGAYPFKSLWSNYERMDGWVTLAHLLVYVVVAASMMTTDLLWKRLFQVTLALSACMSINGFLQMMGVVAIGNGSIAGLASTRIDSTFGNPIYLAAFMLFHVFIAGYLITRSSGKEWSTVERVAAGTLLLVASAIFAGILKAAGVGFVPYLALVAFAGLVMWLMFLKQTYVLSFILVVDTIALFLTSTRGTIVGLLGGSIVVALLVAFFERPGTSKAPESRSSTAWKVAVGYLIVIFLMTGGFFAIRHAEWVQKVGFLSRLSTISLSESTSQSRLINWSIAWNGIKERPLLGWGQENFAIVFDKYYDPRQYLQEPWFDRVHNIFFDWLVAGGFLGLLSYIAVFVAAMWAIWRKTFSRLEASVLTGLLVGYLIHNFFVFDNVSSYILFGTVLAYIAWRNTDADKEQPLWKTDLPRNVGWIVTGVAVLAVWACIYWVNMGAIEQNKLLIQAIVPQQGGVAKNLEVMKSALAIGAFGTQEAREQLTQMAARVAGAGEVGADQKQAFYNAAVDEMTKQEQASPLDARFPLFLGIVQNAFGNYVAAAESLQLAHKNSPKKQAILSEIALNAQARGDIPTMMDALRQAYELETSNVSARLTYAAALIQTGKGALAEELLAPIIPTGEAADQRIMSAYLANKQYDKVAMIWEGKVQAQPNDAQGYFTLAAAYYGMGNIAKSISTLEASEKISPEVKAQAENLIQQVKSGSVKL